MRQGHPFFLSLFFGAWINYVARYLGCPFTYHTDGISTGVFIERIGPLWVISSDIAAKPARLFGCLNIILLAIRHGFVQPAPLILRITTRQRRGDAILTPKVSIHFLDSHLQTTHLYRSRTLRITAIAYLPIEAFFLYVGC